MSELENWNRDNMVNDTCTEKCIIYYCTLNMMSSACDLSISSSLRKYNLDWNRYNLGELNFRRYKRERSLNAKTARLLLLKNVEIILHTCLQHRNLSSLYITQETLYRFQFSLDIIYLSEHTLYPNRGQSIILIYNM